MTAQCDHLAVLKGETPAASPARLKERIMRHEESQQLLKDDELMQQQHIHAPSLSVQLHPACLCPHKTVAFQPAARKAPCLHHLRYPTD